MTLFNFFSENKDPNRDPIAREVERIQKKMEKFLSKKEAQKVASDVEDIARNVDAEICRILSDPRVIKLFSYDGLFFTPRGTEQFHRAFDGIHLLRSLDNSKIACFFSGRSAEAGVRWLLEEQRTHLWEATVRRMNWEEEGHLGVLSREVVNAIMEDVAERRRKAAEENRTLSPGEHAFFQPYEQDLRALPCDDLTSSTKG